MSRYSRCIAALNNEIPDRPPISFDLKPDVELPNVKKAFEHFGAQDKKSLYAAAGIDGFSVWEWNAVMGRYAGTPKVTDNGIACDFWGNAYPGHFGLAACNDITSIESHNWPQVNDFDFSQIHCQAKDIRNQDMVVAAGHVGLGYQIHNMLRGNEQSMYDLADKKYMACYMEYLTAFTLEYLEQLLIAGKGMIDVVRADEDMGMMDRLIINPEMWRKFYKPSWKKAVELTHRYGAKFWIHSCGYIWPLLEDFIEIGVDVWNPFPPYVKDNDHERLKEFRKGRLVLDGGVSHMILVDGTAQQVRDETQRVLDTFAPDGGLLIGPSQVLTPDIPADNIIAMFETALNY
jgi:uroporphyrinogen decarboxylase